MTLFAGLTLSSYLPIAIRAMSSTANTSSSVRVIDSHLHVWANKEEATKAFPYAEGQEPPASLESAGSTSALLKQMDDSGVTGALIVQPINHKFDHSYVIQSIKDHPTRFKGMLLHDPSLSKDDAVSRLEDLVLKGFVGVRFNPYLWPKKKENNDWEAMSSSEAGLAVYKRCAELHMPVGIMCFQGLQLHYDDILALIEASPETNVILDHFGFTNLSSESTFKQLLQLAKYSQVHVKISALFRMKASSYDQLKTERLEPLLKAFGPERLMFGTDFPFVMEQEEQYKGTVHIVQNWLKDNDASVRKAVMGGTTEKLFGSWPSNK